MVSIHHLRRIRRPHETTRSRTPITQVKSSSKSPSRPPRSSHEGRWPGFSVAIYLRTSLTVTSPDSTPCSSTRITRGLKSVKVSHSASHRTGDKSYCLPHSFEYLHHYLQRKLWSGSHWRLEEIQLSMVLEEHQASFPTLLTHGVN